MRVAAILYLVTAVLIFDQLVTGGPFALGLGNLTGAFGDFHSTMGYITGILIISLVIAAWLSKPAYKAFRYTTLVTLLLYFLVGSTSDKTALNGILTLEIAVILFRNSNRRNILRAPLEQNAKARGSIESCFPIVPLLIGLSFFPSPSLEESC